MYKELSRKSPSPKRLQVKLNIYDCLVAQTHPLGQTTVPPPREAFLVRFAS